MTSLSKYGWRSAPWILWIKRKDSLMYVIRIRIDHKSIDCDIVYKAEPPRNPLRYFNDGRGGGGGAEVHIILYPKKSQIQNLSIPKNAYFFSIPKKNSHTNSKLNFCYCWFELMKSTIDTQKFPASFINPKTSLLAKISDPKNPLDPTSPVSRICEWGPWGWTFQVKTPHLSL